MSTFPSTDQRIVCNLSVQHLARVWRTEEVDGSGACNYLLYEQLLCVRNVNPNSVTHTAIIIVDFAAHQISKLKLPPKAVWEYVSYAHEIIVVSPSFSLHRKPGLRRGTWAEATRASPRIACTWNTRHRRSRTGTNSRCSSSSDLQICTNIRTDRESRKFSTAFATIGIRPFCGLQLFIQTHFPYFHWRNTYCTSLTSAKYCACRRRASEEDYWHATGREGSATGRKAETNAGWTRRWNGEGAECYMWAVSQAKLSCHGKFSSTSSDVFQFVVWTSAHIARVTRWSKFCFFWQQNYVLQWGFRWAFAPSVCDHTKRKVTGPLVAF